MILTASLIYKLGWMGLNKCTDVALLRLLEPQNPQTTVEKTLPKVGQPPHTNGDARIPSFVFHLPPEVPLGQAHQGIVIDSNL